MGKIIPIRPGRADKVINSQPQRYKAYEQPINLAQHAIVGPFDFAIPQHYNQEANRIAFEHWEELKAKGPQYQVVIDDVETIIPHLSL